MTTSLSPAPATPTPVTAPLASTLDALGFDGSAVDLMNDACVELAIRGWTSQVVVDDLCDEPEARLRASGDDGSLRVELLVPCEDAPIALHWHAVRIDDDERIVWRGPEQSCPASALSAFVEFLLLPDPHAGTSWYEPVE